MARTLTHDGRARFESLEQRQLLAGDVVANLVGGNLVLEGNEFDNKIVITSGAEAGTFVVTGLEGTTVHLEGEAEASVLTVAGVRNIRLNLGEGADLAAVVGANVRGNLYVDAGIGDDRVFVGTAGDAAELVGQVPTDLSVNVRGKVDIDAEAGADQILVDAAVIGKLNIDAGLDGDLVSLGSEGGEGTSANVRVNGAVHVNLGDGDDQLEVDKVDSRVALSVRGGSGNNTIDLSLVNTGALGILGGDDVDNVTLADIDAHLLGLHAGDGNDVVDAHDSVFSKIGISLGDGDDSLAVANLEARFGALLGGGGEDTLNVTGDLGITTELIRGFEIPPDVNVVPPIRRLLGRLLGRLR